MSENMRPDQNGQDQQPQTFAGQSDEQPEQRSAGQGGQQTAEQQEQARADILSELQDLGQQLESTFRAIVEGPGKSVQREVSKAMRDLGAQVQRAARAMQTPPAQQQGEQQAAPEGQPSAPQSQSRDVPLVREIESTLVSGIQQINQQLRKLTERLEARYQQGEQSRQPEQPQQQGGAQRLHIEREDETGEPPLM